MSQTNDDTVATVESQIPMVIGEGLSANWNALLHGWESGSRIAVCRRLADWKQRRARSHRRNGGAMDATGSLTDGNEDSASPSHGTILMSAGRIDYGSQTISIGNRESTGAVFLSGGSINGTGLVTIGGSTISSGNMATSVGVGSLNISGTGEFVAGNIEFNTGRPPKAILTTLNDAVSISGGTLSVGSIGQRRRKHATLCRARFRSPVEPSPPTHFAWRSTSKAARSAPALAVWIMAVQASDP